MLAFIAWRERVSTARFRRRRRSAIGCPQIRQLREPKQDAATNMPCDRAGGRRGHPHALGAAEGAARHRRPHAARACADRGDRSGRRARSPSWSDPITTRSPREARALAPQAQIFEQTRAARHRACGAGGAPGDRAQARRYSGDVRRHAAGARRKRWPNCARRWRDGAAVAVLGFTPADPTGYGRLVMRGDELIAIREEHDASAGGAQDRASAMAG